MTQFSPHFDHREFELEGAAIPDEAFPAFAALCVEVLEPTRERFGVEFLITSGYRSAAVNAAEHGVPDSEHMATAERCACDFYPVGMQARPIFDWMRGNAALPFHQLILEHGKVGSIIHVSYNRLKLGVRSVLEGATHNAEPYRKVECAEYRAPMEFPATEDV